MGVLNWYTKFWFKLTIAILIWENIEPCFGQKYTFIDV